MNAIVVGRATPTGDRKGQGIVIAVSPALEVISAEPDGVGKSLVATAGIKAASFCFLLSVGALRVEPAGGFAGFSMTSSPRPAASRKHRTDASEIGLVGRGEITKGQERGGAVKRAAVGVAAGSVVAPNIHPQDIKAVALAVGEIPVGIRQIELPDRSLRRVA